MNPPRIVIVTGGGTGIGLAIARRFAAAGERIAIGSRNPDHLRAAREAIPDEQLLTHGCDVRHRDQIASFTTDVVNAWGPIHILVNNAATGGRNPIDEDLGDFFGDMMETNVTGVFHFIRRVLPEMPAGGRIINISSVLGKFGVPASSAYCASKHAVIGLTRSLAIELAPRDITVNAVCPGWVDTEMARMGMEQVAKLMGTSFEQFKKKALGHVPIQRFVEPDEVAAMVFYLAQPEAAAITGQAINVCGGQSFY